MPSWKPIAVYRTFPLPLIPAENIKVLPAVSKKYMDSISLQSSRVLESLGINSWAKSSFKSAEGGPSSRSSDEDRFEQPKGRPLQNRTPFGPN